MYVIFCLFVFILFYLFVCFVCFYFLLYLFFIYFYFILFVILILVYFLFYFISYFILPGNERLQQMIALMSEQRGGKVFAMDDRYCIGVPFPLFLRFSLFFFFHFTVLLFPSLLIFFFFALIIKDNGAMIAWTGLLMHKHGHVTPLDDTFCTQRFEKRKEGREEGEKRERRKKKETGSTYNRAGSEQTK